MKLQHEVAIPQPAETVWAFVMDVPRVAACLPGAGRVSVVGPDRYAGRLTVKVGPISLSLDGTVVVTASDPTERRATMQVDAADRRIGGAVRATMVMHLVPSADGAACRLAIDTDARIMGRIGDFGQSVIKRKADQVVDAFAANIAAALSERPDAT
jgi:carbon monoxide dehydrogenase subunit G